MVVLMRTTARWVMLPEPAPAPSALPDDEASLGTPMCSMMVLVAGHLQLECWPPAVGRSTHLVLTPAGGGGCARGCRSSSTPGVLASVFR